MQEYVALRQEIIEAEKARADFQKWKLIIVAGLAAAALGLTDPPSSSHAPSKYLILCCVPPVCWYVDILCGHLTLRTLVIGAFLRNYPVKSTEGLCVSQQYEVFVAGARTRAKAFGLEDWAMYISTLALSLAVAVLGVSLSYFQNQPSWPYVVAGVVGIALTAFSWLFAKMTANDIDRLAIEYHGQLKSQ